MLVMTACHIENNMYRLFASHAMPVALEKNKQMQNVPYKNERNAGEIQKLIFIAKWKLLKLLPRTYRQSVINNIYVYNL